VPGWEGKKEKRRSAKGGLCLSGRPGPAVLAGKGGRRREAGLTSTSSKEGGKKEEEKRHLRAAVA